MQQPLPVGSRIVAASFLTSGVVHLVRPAVFYPLIPRTFGDPHPWVLGSGIAELACAAGLLTRRRWAPPATTLTLAVIWVGNWQYAIAVQRSSHTPWWLKAAAWARLPLQAPLLVWAWRSPTHGRPSQ